MFSYLTTDAQALGVLSWISTIITTVGLAVAIWQIRKVGSTADAAKKAAEQMTGKVKGREALLSLASSLAELDRAISYATSEQIELSGLCLDRSHSMLVAAAGLLTERPEEQKSLERLGILLSNETKKSIKLARSQDVSSTCVGHALSLTKHREKIRVVVAKLRFEFE